jgi:DHA2 family multidrug resistance protein-like MFS transporter
MGGALGVAVIGSVFASSYRPAISSRLTELGAPTAVIEQARDSVGGALQAASGLPGGLAETVANAARTEYVNAFQGALLVGAVVVAVAAAVVFLFLPARAGDARAPVEGPLDGLASLAAAEAEFVLEEDAADGGLPDREGSRRMPTRPDTQGVPAGTDR